MALLKSRTMPPPTTLFSLPRFELTSVLFVVFSIFSQDSGECNHLCSPDSEFAIEGNICSSILMDIITHLRRTIAL